ncbi:MAG: uroporphyrinogen decarboxylase family protein, partial [Ignavibacteria bacterium]
MLPKERVKAAMDLEKPDRTPLMCQFSIGHMLMQLNVSPSEFWFDAGVYEKGLLELREIYDFDGILISLFGHDPFWRKEVVNIEPFGDGEKIEWKNGDITYCLKNDLPQYEFKFQPVSPEISELTEETLPQSIHYIPVSQNLHFKIQQEHKFDIIRNILNKTGNKYSIHGEITSPFDYMLDLLGIQNALLYLLMEPEKCRLILNHFTKLLKNLAAEMCQTGIDAVKISSPFAGSGFISPSDYAEFVLPFEKEIAEEIRMNGVHVYTHT